MDLPAANGRATRPGPRCVRAEPARTSIQSRARLRFPSAAPGREEAGRRLGALLLVVVAISGCGGSTGPELEPQRTAASASEPGRHRAVFLGDSLTAGYNLRESEAYPALIQRKIDEAGLPFEAVNAGVSGDTSAGGLQRLGWVLSRGARVVVVALGANDGLRGMKIEATRQNLSEIVRRVRETGARAVLAGMQLPPNYGPDYTQRFRGMYGELGAEHDVPVVPFLLEEVGGVREHNLADGVHPNAEGQKVIAKTVWATLEPVLREALAPAAAPPPWPGRSRLEKP